MNDAGSFLPTAFIGLKILTILGLSLYTVFSFVVFRQEQLMAGVLDEAFEPVLKVLVIGHFLVSLSILFLAILIL